jgi:hypothetical protein
MNCPAPHLWSEVTRADGSTWLVMRCDRCGVLVSCDPKRLRLPTPSCEPAGDPRPHPGPVALAAGSAGWSATEVVRGDVLVVVGDAVKVTP